ncbi:MAG TPA: Ig-like domain-containing protein, partial [Acidobacteriaceae bacterium]|nr:Ig-like domain-containing protein [Acidobacteriaceae bacterium]
LSFISGGATLATVPLDSAGTAMLTTALPNGNDSITAQYAGDANYLASTSNAVSVSVGMLATTTSIAASPSPANLGASITLTAAIMPATGSGIPTGLVTFSDGSTSLGAATVDGTGTASFSTSTLAAGAHSITAVYSGDADYTASTSTALALTINAPAFALTIAPSTLTVAGGSTGQATITLTPAGGFNTQTTFSCTGLPSFSTCNFSPASLTPNGSNAPITSTVTIATNVQSTSASASPHPRSPFDKPNPTLLALAFLGLPSLIVARRRFAKMKWLSAPVLLFAATLAFAAMGLLGCGGGGGSSKSMTNTTPKGTSTVTVTAAAGTSSQTAALTFTVN